MKRSESFFSFLLVPLDIVALLSAFTLAYFTRAQSDVIYIWDFSQYFKFILTMTPFWILVFALGGLYKNGAYKKGTLDEFGNVFLGVSAGIMFVVAYLFLSRIEFFSRLVVLYSWVYAIVIIFILRQILKYIARLLLKYGVGVHRVIVIGKNESHKELVSAINHDYRLGLKIVKIIDRDGIEKLDRILSSTEADEIIMADPSISEKEVLTLIEYCQQRGLAIKLVPNLFRVRSTNVSFETVATVPLMEFKRTPLDGWGAIIKRIVDIILSVVLMFILSPLFLIIALIIKLTSPNGPVLFCQERVGLKKNFGFLKFRSMIPDAHKLHDEMIEKHGNMFKLKEDPRVTPFGRLLRKTSLDELPQLWNVLKGEMSLVGPRPPMPEEVRRYQAWERRRLGIKPGITGLWQVSGRSELDFEEWVRLDVYYIENWSLWLDFKIMLKTILVVLDGNGAY